MYLHVPTNMFPLVVYIIIYMYIYYGINKAYVYINYQPMHTQYIIISYMYHDYKCMHAHLSYILFLATHSGKHINQSDS